MKILRKPYAVKKTISEKFSPLTLRFFSLILLRRLPMNRSPKGLSDKKKTPRPSFDTTTMSAQKTLVHFKVQLQRRDNPTLHRFSGSYTYEEFLSVVAHLWGHAPKTLILEYVDPEGDTIRLSGGMEWEECMRLYREDFNEAPLRVFARRHKKEDKVGEKREAIPTESVSRSPGAPEQPVSLPSESELSESPVASSVARPAVPPLAIPTMTQEKKAAPKKPTLVFERLEHQSVMDLLSMLFQCNAAEQLVAGSVSQFGPAVRLIPSADSTEVHLDIDLPAIYSRTVKQTNELLDSRRYEEAERILRTALAVFQDNKLLEYNLACALSLQGQLEEAFNMLNLATAHGYDNVEHLMKDPDLAGLRTYPAFIAAFVQPQPQPQPLAAAYPPAPFPAPAAVVNPLQPVVAEVPQVPAAQPSASNRAPTSQVAPRPAESAPVAPTPQAQPEPAPTVVPQVLAQPVPPEVMTLQSIFPGMSVDEAKHALRAARGNVTVAVNQLLSR